MQFNYVLLKQKLIEQGLSLPALAIRIGMKYSTLKVKLDNQSSFKASEIVAICRVLEIPIQTAWCYFFVEVDK